MESSERLSPSFTLRGLFVLIGILCLLLAIFVPLVRLSRAREQRAQCMNNLKHIGLAIHNFHDIRQEIVPSYLTDDQSEAAAPRDYATWPVLLLPFIEQNRLYDFVDLGLPLNRDPSAGSSSQGPNHMLVRQTEVPTYLCPVRRHGMLTRDGQGTTGDYACVARADLNPNLVPGEPPTWDGAMLVSRAFNPTSAANVTILGGFQPGALGPRDYRSMTSFADVLDGLSNTVFIGEKAVHADRLGGDPSGSAKTQHASQQDGTLFYGSGAEVADLKAPGAIAYWSRRLAPAAQGDKILPLRPRAEDPQNRFGGWHGGVTLFLMGDGSVGLINHQVSTSVLQRLGCRNDRQGFKATVHLLQGGDGSASH